jgi:hypothetical protein
MCTTQCNIKELYILSTKFIDMTTSIIKIGESYSLNSINRLNFLITKACVLCEVETEVLYTLIGIVSL